MKKRCHKCKRVKTTDKFYKNRANKSGLTTCCAECGKSASRKWHKKNPEKARENCRRWHRDNPDRVRFHRLKAAGLTPEQYAHELKKANGRCSICNRRSKSLVMDHDHRTGKFRSFLCLCCNTGLGKFGDSVRTLLKAAAYLAKHI